MLRILSFLILLTSLVSCESKLGKFEEDVLFSKATNDSIGRLLKQLDTNQVLKLRGKSKMMLLNFNIELGNDTLDIKTAADIDGFIQSYRATDFFTADIRQLRKGQEEQSKRLEKLQADIENEAGDRSSYFEHVQLERKEAEELRKHSLILEKHFKDFKQAYEQFKPKFERFKGLH
jgi:hypothetical protein